MKAVKLKGADEYRAYRDEMTSKPLYRIKERFGVGKLPKLMSYDEFMEQNPNLGESKNVSADVKNIAEKNITGEVKKEVTPPYQFTIPGQESREIESTYVEPVQPPVPMGDEGMRLGENPYIAELEKQSEAVGITRYSDHLKNNVAKT